MSDTPRTDARVRMMIDNNISPEGLEYFARDLERELNESRQIASKYDDRYFATRELLTVSTERAERLERELNEARTRIKQLEEAGNEVVWWFCQKEESQLSAVQSEALKRWRDLRGRRSP